MMLPTETPLRSNWTAPVPLQQPYNCGPFNDVNEYDVGDIEASIEAGEALTFTRRSRYEGESEDERCEAAPAPAFAPAPATAMLHRTDTDTDTATATATATAAATTTTNLAPTTPTPDDASLTAEQANILQLALAGQSIFFTGSAGTGKSFLLRRIIVALKSKMAALNLPNGVVVTAPTGIAACNVGGVTLHSFGGIGQGREPRDKLLAIVKRSSAAKNRWRDAAVLVIDEISMLDGGLFDKLDYIARRVREKEDRPFGGIQLILAGDFFQLPPVGMTGGDKSSAGAGAGAGDAPPAPIKFAFEAAAWAPSLYAQRSLRKVFRQKDDVFVSLLNNFRTGVVSPDAERLLRDAGGALRALEAERAPTKPTSVFALNRMVDEVNERELAKCSTEAPRVYNADDTGQEPYLSTMRSSCIAPTSLCLKVGAQVMLLKNIDAKNGLVNGARGVVVSYENDFPVVTFVRSVHAANVVDASDAGAGASAGAGAGSGSALVEEDPLTRVIHQEEWSIELGSQKVALRRQLPLKLAYALSIHKSQGMTIDLLDISMNGIFEYGQAYVAISRAVALDRVRIRGFTPGCVRAHPTVALYYAWLEDKGKKGPFVPPPRERAEEGAAVGYGGGGFGGGANGGGGGGGGGATAGACFKCGRPGHFSRECPGGGGRGGGGGAPVGARPASAGLACFKCRQPGHYANACPGVGAWGGGGASPVVQRRIEDVPGGGALLRGMHGLPPRT